MAELSLDNVIGYSDLVLLDTSFVSRDFGVGQRLFYLENFYECGIISEETQRTIRYYEELRKIAVKFPDKIKINQEVADEFNQFATHIQNCLGYYQLQKSTIEGKVKRRDSEGTNKYRRIGKVINKTREQALDFQDSEDKKDKEIYGASSQRKMAEINALYLSITALARRLERYYGKKVRLDRLMNISETDYRIVESALGSLVDEKVKKTSVITSDQDLIELLASYYYSQRAHPGYLGKVFVYKIGRNSNKINELELKEKSSLELKPDRLIYMHDRCDGHGSKVQTKMFPMQKELGSGYQPNSICDVLRMPEESNGRRDNRPRA